VSDRKKRDTTWRNHLWMTSTKKWNKCTYRRKDRQEQRELQVKLKKGEEA